MNERDETLLLNIKDELEMLMELADGYDLERFLSRIIECSFINRHLFHFGC